MLRVITWLEDGTLHLLTMSWFAGWGVPAVLAAIGASWKAMAKPKGPTPYGVIFKWPTVPPEDRAFGFDLLIGALGLQLGFLALEAARDTQISHARFGGLSLVLIATIALIPFERFFGYEKKGNKVHLKQDLGVALPNILGILVLIVVYNASR